MSKIFSGIQPTGPIHVGNYAGAVKNWVRLQESNTCVFCIVDYHAMTVDYDPGLLPQKVLQVARDLIACGVDPEKALLYTQSDVPEHTELSWILSCVAPMGELNRMTQFKEKSSHVESICLGLYSYPVLQTADILLYKSEEVPVGEDQLQHLELCREVTRRFNQKFGEIFPEPKPLLTKSSRLMCLSDPTKKMSKSIPGSALMLTADEATVRKMIKKAVTGMGEPGEIPIGVQNLLNLFEVFDATEQREFYRDAQVAGTIRYGDLKNDLTEVVLDSLRVIQERARALDQNPEKLKEILHENGKKARSIARETLDEVRSLVGLS